MMLDLRTGWYTQISMGQLDTYGMHKEVRA